MDENNPVLLIERLSVFTIVVAIINSIHYRQVFFVHETRIVNRFLLPLINRFFGDKIKKLNNIDFIGLFYEYMEQACSYANDFILNKNINNLYIHVSLKFCGNNEYITAIEKELLNRYVAPRVKTYVIVKKVAEKYQNVTFFPADNEDIASAFSPPFILNGLCRIPLWISSVNAIKQICLEVAGFILFPALLVGVCIKTLQKGIVFHTPERNYYTYGIDMQRNGLIGERGLDTVTNKFFLYDNSDFAPEKYSTSSGVVTGWKRMHATYFYNTNAPLSSLTP